MSERNPRRRPPYSPTREYDDNAGVLVFRDVPEEDWLTTPKRLDVGTVMARSAELKRMPYKDYLKSDEWRRLRLMVLRRAGGRCERCGKNNGEWNVHHLTYDRRGNELLSDLVLLCKRCHDVAHGIAS